MQKEISVIHSNPKETIAAIKRNDDAVLKNLYTENYKKVEHYVLDNNGTAEEAKDLYQEAFLAVWRNIQLDKFVPLNGSSLSGYLYQVAKNKWLDHLRSGHYKNTISLEAVSNGYPAIEDPTEQEYQYLNVIKQNFSKLGDNCQELLRRFYYRKEPLRMIAMAFDWTEATAKNNKYRCLQRLRELIKHK